jgi:hypothetical protein
MPDVRKTLTDAGYIAIGLGVMGFQQAQVQRRELQGRLESASTHLGEAARDGKARVEDLVGEVGHRVEPLMERVDGRVADLPDPVNRAVQPVYTKIRELVGSAS